MTMGFKEFTDLPTLVDVLVTKDARTVEALQEGKWVSGKFENNIRIDQPTHGVGQTHAHVLGRKGNELGVVNIDGSASHGTKCRLSDVDADALRGRGFKIRAGNIVEWVVISGSEPKLLLG